MSTVDEIEAAILQLAPSEFHRLASWLQELKEQRWDQQLAEDVAAGKLDAFAQAAIADHKAGRSRPL